MRKKAGIIKRAISLLLVFLLSINSFAAVVSDNDGSAFITKAEFDSLKNSFQSQIDSYNTSIDSKIDGAIAAYLAGIRVASKTAITPIMGNTLSFTTGLSTGDSYTSSFQSYYQTWPHNSGTQALFLAADQYNSQISTAMIRWTTKNYSYGFCMADEADGIVSVADYDSSKFYSTDGIKKYQPERFFWVVDDINSTKPVCIGLGALCPNQYGKIGGHLWAGDNGGKMQVFAISDQSSAYTTYWPASGMSSPWLETVNKIFGNTISLSMTGKYATSYTGSSSSASTNNKFQYFLNGSVFTYGNPDGTTDTKALGTSYLEGYATHHWTIKNKLDTLWACGSTYANPQLWKFDSTNYVNWSLNKQYDFDGILNITTNSRTKAYHSLKPTGNLDPSYMKETIVLYGMDADTYLQDLVAKPYENFQEYGSHYWDGAVLFKSPSNGTVTIKMKSDTARRIYLQKEPFTNLSTPTSSKLVEYSVDSGLYTNYSISANVSKEFKIENVKKNEVFYIKPNGTAILTIENIEIEG